MYSLLDKDQSISALKYARREYGKFKRSFMQVAYDSGYEGSFKIM